MRVRMRGGGSWGNARSHHELVMSPVSCGGLDPASCVMEIHCERTVRASSSKAPGAELPASSSAAPRRHALGQ